MLGLAFSGGKDSLACWYMYKNQDPIVFWVNTGKAYPETVDLINEIKAQAKEFIEVKSDQQAQNDEVGIPSDLVPIDYTQDGMVFTCQKPIKIQSYINCCASNIWLPLMNAIKNRGITRLVRGQRNDESHRSTFRNGDVVDGVTFIQPIDDWSKAQVFNFLLTQRFELPKHFNIEHSSLDCYDCTAYLSHSADRIAWASQAHPAMHRAYSDRMQKLKSALAPSLAIIEAHT